MSDILSHNPPRAVDANGRPVPGARASFYESGTTNPIQTYADAALTALNPPELTADGSGFFPPAFVEDGRAIKVDVIAPEGWRLPGYPVDPVMRSTTGGNGAAQISFVPTGDIPETNVQKAIERVQANLGTSYQQYGLGVNGDAPLLSNLDLTNHRTGQYRYDSNTTGTFPGGVIKGDGGVIEISRVSASRATMALTPSGSLYPHVRQMVDLVWGGWRRNVSAEYGSNANGEFWKFDCGLMICRQSLSATITTSAIGSLHRGTAGGWTYPVAFSAAPAVTIVARGGAVWGGAGIVSITALTDAYVWSANSLASSVVPVDMTAIGRWY